MENCVLLIGNRRLLHTDCGFSSAVPACLDDANVGPVAPHAHLGDLLQWRQCLAADV